MARRPKFNPEIRRVKLNPEQAVLACSCAGATQYQYRPGYHSGGGLILACWRSARWTGNVVYCHAASGGWAYRTAGSSASS